MKNYQQTPKQLRLQKKKVESAKRQLALSTPRFDPRENWASRKKIGGVPVGTLNHKQHIFLDDPWPAPFSPLPRKWRTHS